MPLTILIVDDEPSNLAIMRDILCEQYRLVFATTGAQAEAAVARQRPALVLLDIGLPDTDGVSLCQRLKAMDPDNTMRVMFVTSYCDVEHEEAGFQAGCVDYIVKPVSPSLVRARVATQLALVRASVLERSHHDAILMLGRAGHYNDNDTGTHIWRMAAYARALALDFGWDCDRADLLELAAPMHDTGKLGIPDSILRKPGALDASEWVVMRGHPAIGHAILSQSQAPVFRLAAEVALCHHEKWDGSGYPGGLTGSAIPESARIVAMADVFDALSMARPYKAPWPVDRISAHMTDNCGTHFDPAIVDCYFRILPRLIEIQACWHAADSSAGLPLGPGNSNVAPETNASSVSHGLHSQATPG
jgi:putative two-component system response regulator